MSNHCTVAACGVVTASIILCIVWYFWFSIAAFGFRDAFVFRGKQLWECMGQEGMQVRYPSLSPLWAMSMEKK
jgi:hypothetical protein